MNKRIRVSRSIKKKPFKLKLGDLDRARRDGDYVIMSDRDYYRTPEGPWVRMDRVRSEI